jgi:hypothetical protein
MNWFTDLFAPPPPPPQKLVAQPIEINVSPGSTTAIERNKARMGRLQAAIEKGQSTPEIEAELAARQKTLESLREALKE